MRRAVIKIHSMLWELQEGTKKIQLRLEEAKVSGSASWRWLPERTIRE